MLGLKLNHVSKSSYRTWKRLLHYSAHCKENPCTSPSYCRRPIIQMHFQEIALFPFKFHLSFSYRVNWQHYEFRCWNGAAHAINHYLNLCSDHVHIMLIGHSELITWTWSFQFSPHVIIMFAYMRGGSSFLGGTLQENPDVFYWYEPLWDAYNGLASSGMFQYPIHTVMDEHENLRSVPFETSHDDVMTWKGFSHYCPFVKGIPLTKG